MAAKLASAPAVAFGHENPNQARNGTIKLLRATVIYLYSQVVHRRVLFRLLLMRWPIVAAVPKLRRFDSEAAEDPADKL